MKPVPSAATTAIDRAQYRADDWVAAPFFKTVAPLVQRLCWSEWPAPETYYAGLNALGAPCRFIAQASTLAYELHVSTHREVPTRYANWHDWFNALIWAAFPHGKLALNALHRAHWSEGLRVQARDTATLLDESGAILLCDDAAMLDALRAHRWHEAFVERRAQWTNGVRVFLFGHGLLEKCLHPYIGMTAQALLWQVPTEILQKEEAQPWLDDALANRIHAAELTQTQAFSPLPLLGIPDWWGANETESFYDNRAYFRPRRM